MTHLPGSASGACFAGSHSPWPLPSAPGHVALAIAVGVAPLRAAKINVEALID